VRQGEFCWVAGTVYKDMPLKPNILDDISKDVRFSDSSIDVKRANLLPSTGYLRPQHARSTSLHLERIGSC